MECWKGRGGEERCTCSATLLSVAEIMEVDPLHMEGGGMEDEEKQALSSLWTGWVELVGLIPLRISDIFLTK